MKLVWTTRGIPHGFLCETPIHLIYRVKGCAPVNQLSQLADDLTQQLAVLRSDQNQPADRVQRVLEEQLEVYDQLLDAQDQSKYVLSKRVAAEEVIASWRGLHSRGEIHLYAVCVMGNHVHALLRGGEGREDAPIGQLVSRHKRFTNRRIREAMGLETNVWDSGFYDRYVRPGTFERVLWYVINNPVKAGLIRDWRAWAGTYVDEGLGL